MPKWAFVNRVIGPWLSSSTEWMFVLIQITIRNGRCLARFPLHEQGFTVQQSLVSKPNPSHQTVQTVHPSNYQGTNPSNNTIKVQPYNLSKVPNQTNHLLHGSKVIPNIRPSNSPLSHKHGYPSSNHIQGLL